MHDIIVVQYWTGEDPIKAVTRGVWQTFPQGTVTDGKGKTETIRLSGAPMPVRFLRIWMTESSNTCDADGAESDPQKLRGLCDSRTLPRNQHGRRRLSRHPAPHTRSGADDNLLLRRLIPGISRPIWDRPSRRRWDSICSSPAAYARPARHDAGRDAL